jgi:hypothetical protein
MALIGDVPEFKSLSRLTPNDFRPSLGDSLTKYFDGLYTVYTIISNTASDKTERFKSIQKNKVILDKRERDYYNYNLRDIVTKPLERKKIIIYKNSLVQNIDPIYLDPYNKGFFNFRTHFFAPYKYIFGRMTDTFTFNISFVLLSTILLYLILYYELLGKFVRFIENLRIRK